MAHEVGVGTCGRPPWTRAYKVRIQIHHGLQLGHRDPRLLRQGIEGFVAHVGHAGLVRVGLEHVEGRAF